MKIFIKNTARFFLLIFPLVILTIPLPATADEIHHIVSHTFSVDDMQGGFDGSVYGGVEGSILDDSIICGLTADDGSVPVPCDETQPIQDKKTGEWLYPVDSEFGFYVSDFVGAAGKERDDDYAEGWVSNVLSSGEVIGLRLSNAATDTFKVKYPMGTWCVGMGANTVKCSTEHYSVMEHIKTCYETIPYDFADPATGDQGDLLDPATLNDDVPTVIATCDEGRLDNVMKLVVDGVVSDDLLNDGLGIDYATMEPNESTVRDDIGVGADYGITKKDDGKALYRFGSMVKRPNDLRMYARMALPQEWKDNPDTAYEVYSAELHIDHLITNNPNDQVRPEDMENEGATGRLPEYTEVGEQWVSAKNCYEGDGDYIPAGTVFKNPNFSAAGVVTGLELGSEPEDPEPYSADLSEGFTNAWYTTTDRDPFEADPVSSIGPRWRLKANKFGQDIPGLEIPSEECIPVPYTSAFIKYSTGEATTVVLNLLDWEDADSPLKDSLGWISPEGNFGNEAVATGLSVNGLPLTEDFDLAVYVKGDRKATAIYNATLYITYEGEGDGNEPPQVETFDLALVDFHTPRRVFVGSVTKAVRAFVSNNGPNISTAGYLNLQAHIESTGVRILNYNKYFDALAPAETARIVIPWTAPDSASGENVIFTATINSAGDSTDDNNTLTDETYVR